MTQPTVSIGIPVWNGEAFLAETLESLLAQDYRNLEIIILDNRSTDRTPEICKTFVQRDARVRYILDDVQKDVMQGHKKTAQLATGEFFMVACDDDWYAPEYVSTLLRHIRENTTVGLVYSGWGWIHPDGSMEVLRSRGGLKASNSKFYNFAYYLLFRRPIPLAFGIVRTEFHRDALEYFYRPDHRGWNHDNLYMLRLLSVARIANVSDTLFYYRQRDRHALYKQRGQNYNPESAFAEYWNHILHQVSVTRAVAKIIDASPFNLIEKFLLQAYSLLVLLFYCGPRYLLLIPIYRKLRNKRS